MHHSSWQGYVKGARAMTTLQWLEGFITSMLSYWLLWPVVGFVVWLVFAVKIAKVHHVTNEDIARIEQKEQIS
jgi:hypothetical protein